MAESPKQPEAAFSPQQPETAPEPQPQTAPEPQPQTAPEPQPQTAPEPQPQTAPEPQPVKFPDPEVQLRSVDMPEHLVDQVIEISTAAINESTIEKEIAQFIKQNIEHKDFPTWHCIVGRNFGSFVTHETNRFIYFYLGHYAILLFKTQ